ncbi:MAG: CRISPR-associated endonuclease Cas1 [Alphaproteobacteria bacterium]|nr:CRISPR-associated endonuclease Cas1 [Alphaproteobacteria bacterium]
MDKQFELSLPAPPVLGDAPLVPARMVNEWVYCPRLAYLEWVEGEWAETGDTAEGARAHARADKGGGELPAPEEAADEDSPAKRVRSVTLSSERLGVIAKMDMIDAEDGAVTPIDIKKGKRPHVAEGAYEPERAQVCAQALILEDNGYRVTEGALWYAASRERVRVELSPALRETTLRAISELRLAAASGRRPPPLIDSPKCVRCALAGICLPDETNFFRKGAVPRPLNPADDPALPLYVQTPGARIRKSGEEIIVETDDGKIETPLISVSEVALFGPVSLTTPTLHELFRRNTPVAWFSTGGWLMGHTHGTGPENAYIRTNQYRASFDEARSRAIARGLVAAKIKNQRTMLRRNWRDEKSADGKDEALGSLKRLIARAEHAESAQALLGFEGEAAAIYFRYLDRMIASPADADLASGFSFEKRNRRPPEDPVNAMLSLSYALLMRTFFAALQSVGFDPYRGFYHVIRHGRPALALDMMEPYRPILADSAVISAINNGEVKPDGFYRNGPSCMMKSGARKALIAAYERRLDQETTHPLFGYRVSMRRLIEVQVRLLARHLDGEIKEYPHYTPR